MLYRRCTSVAVHESSGPHKVLAQICTELPFLRRYHHQLLRGVLKDQVAVRRLTVKHAEAKFVLLLPAIKLLGINEEIYISVYLRLVVSVISAARDDRIRRDFSQITMHVIGGWPASTIRAK